MNLAPVLLAWNLARQQAGLAALRVTPALTMRANRQLANWKPGTDPEPAFSSYGMVAVTWCGHETPAWVAQQVLGAPYHRSTILGGSVTEGIAEATVGTCHAVLAVFGGWQEHRPPFVLWLPPQVPAQWIDDEYPSPFGLPVGAVTGWPILVRTTNLAGQASGATLTGPSGPVAVKVNSDFGGSWSLLVLPTAPLAPGTYRLAFEWHGSGRPVRVVRTFTVGGGN